MSIKLLKAAIRSFDLENSLTVDHMKKVEDAVGKHLSDGEQELLRPLFRDRRIIGDVKGALDKIWHESPSFVATNDLRPVDELPFVL